jgi:hypothetical protein
MVRVVSIIGYTRSGSTLLDSILGELDGVFSAGELHYLWARGILEHRSCGCGSAVVDCPVWSRVLERAFGAHPPDPRRVVGWQDRSVRTRHTPALLMGGRGGIDQHALTALTRAMSHVYRSIADVTGDEVIVDSSKRPSDAALTMLIPEIEPFVVHLVRDPRAVVFSWRRSKRELDRPDAGDMPLRSPSAAAAGWVGMNVVAEAVRRRAGARGMLVRYEDLAARPVETVHAIATFAGAKADVLPFVGEDQVRLGENHTVSGNPGRFRRGVVSVRPDIEWRTAMRPEDRMVTTAITAPLRWRYGYPASPDEGD